MKKFLLPFVSIILIGGCATTPLTPQQVQANSLVSAMVNRLDLTGKSKTEIVQMFGYPNKSEEGESRYSFFSYGTCGELILGIENNSVKGGRYEPCLGMGGEIWAFGADPEVPYNGLSGYQRAKKQIEDSEKAYQKFESERRMKAINEHPEWSVEVRTKILNGSFAIGMTQEQVLASLGNPSDVNRTVGKFGGHEQWIYGLEDYERKYLYFEDGILKSYQD